MNSKRYRIIIASLAIVLLIMAIGADSVYFGRFEYRYRTRNFNKVLHEKETVLENCLNGMRPLLAGENHHGSITENSIFSEAERNNITILEYIDSKLIYWSDNTFEVPHSLDSSLFKQPLIFLQNGWFLSRTIEAGNEKIVGLLRLRTDFNFENDIIKSGFEKSFGVTEKTGFTTDKTITEFHVYDKSGEYLFSLVFPEVREKTIFIMIPFGLWVGVFILILILSTEIVKYLVNRNKGKVAVVLSFLFFTAIYFFILLTRKPSILFQTDLFSPYRFSLNGFIPTLGHLLLLGVLVAVFSIILYNFLLTKERRACDPIKDYLYLTIVFVVSALYISIYQYVFSQLILTSNINFETYKALELNLYSVVGFISMVLLLLPALVILKTLRNLMSFTRPVIILSVLTSLIIPFIFFMHDRGSLLPLILFYIILILCIQFTNNRNIGLFNTTVVFSLVLGLYSLYFITLLSDKKIAENMKIMAVSYSSENDPEAEQLLLDLWPSLSTDTVLTRIMKAEYFNKSDYDNVSEYLHQTYFTGYLGNFNFNIVICRNDQFINVDSDDDTDKNCFSFFDERIRMNGQKLTGTDFYFINNQGGRSYYLGRLFFRSDSGITNGLFIDLYNDVNVFQPGYSELLLDKNYHNFSGLKDYSLAKYINGEIVIRTGDFPYKKSDEEYVGENSEYRIYSEEGYKHVLYTNGNATVIISKPLLTLGDVLISFAYLFAFILLVSNIFVMLLKHKEVKGISLLSFRQKLQLTFIGILLFSFILIGIVVAFLSINQFHTKHQENIKEKLNSIYLELDNKLAMEEQLNAAKRGNGYSSLNDLLIGLSNVFNTDINLYDLNGFLIATSRPEIFYNDLTSRRMNNLALINLKDLTKAEYFQTENIGSLEYISAYVPFFNSENRLLAYVNIPYFRMQSLLAKEISNMIVAVINFTLLLIVITMSLAVFISGMLTSPFKMLNEGLASVGVGKKSEHLQYNGNDEIGELVKQYNRMVDEIEISSEKLTNSEREYAWREMARQIAHEIKNPLTPMKLNVQQLFKSWNDNIPGFDKAIERFTHNQIEYIDNLSSIATAFSNFAKMPSVKPAEVNLPDQVKTSLELFKNTDNVIFKVRWPREKKVIVYADKEQLNGVFSNLIKNGIQSVPPEREGVIGIDFQIVGDKVVLSFSDNGTGIPEELQNKLFTPNFTTKSSGMGLGLSIVKKYIESANGKIWFESVADEGSIFYIELPLMYTVEKP
jgi:two-component system, NtrC family, nitrogen regulation sensor histidine kinase NtrY